MADDMERRDVDVAIEAGHPSRPDREELMRAHLARVKARALREAAVDHEAQQKADAHRYGVHRPWTDAVNFLNRRADAIEKQLTRPGNTSGPTDA